MKDNIIFESMLLSLIEIILRFDKQILSPISKLFSARASRRHINLLKLLI
jgi:hypothetical protein